MKAIAHGLNQARVPFPAKDTKRGPARLGWAVSTVYTIVRNEKYAGIWIWNRTRFLKDPDTGRRRPVPRPPDEWIRQERPALRIIDAELWAVVQARLAFVHEAFGFRGGRPQRGRASVAYSPYLLSGILRCGPCGARMTGQTVTRWKHGRAYRYGWYRCGFAAAKGPSVCGHSVGYRRDRLEAALLEKFHRAMTPPMVETLTRIVNTHVEAATQHQTTRIDQLKAEILQIEQEVGRLVRFLAQGGEPETVRDELRTREAILRTLRLELSKLAALDREAPPRVHPTWLLARLERLDHLLRRDPVRAKAELAKHLDGQLTLAPLPSVERDRRAEIRGRVKLDGLLEGQEAVLQYVGCGGWI
jgi:site-specific DNA recombinase